MAFEDAAAIATDETTYEGDDERQPAEAGVRNEQ